MSASVGSGRAARARAGASRQLSAARLLLAVTLAVAAVGLVPTAAVASTSGPCDPELGSTAGCSMQAITVPADPADPDAAHVTYSGATTRLKGIARYGGNQFQWDFGDGSAPTAWTAFADPSNLSVLHVYTGAVGQVFTATLSVRNSGTPAVVATDTYPVR